MKNDPLPLTPALAHRLEHAKLTPVQEPTNDALACVVEDTSHVGALAFVPVSRQVASAFLKGGRALVSRRSLAAEVARGAARGAGTRATSNVHGLEPDNTGGPYLLAVASSATGSFVGSMLASIAAPFLSAKVKAWMEKGPSETRDKTSLSGSPRLYPDGSIRGGVFPAGSVSDNTHSLDAWMSDDGYDALDGLGTVNLGNGGPPEQVATKAAIEAIVRAIPDMAAANTAMTALPKAFAELAKQGIYPTMGESLLEARKGNFIDMMSAVEAISPEWKTVVGYAKKAGVSLYKKGDVTPVVPAPAAACNCPAAKSAVAEGRGALPCPAGCVVSGVEDNCGSFEEILNGDVGAITRKIGRYNVTLQSPLLIAKTAETTPEAKKAIADLDKLKESLSKVKVSGVDDEEDNSSGFGDSVFEAVMRGGAVVGDTLLPGHAGTLLAEGGRQIKKKVDTETGHDSGAPLPVAKPVTVRVRPPAQSTVTVQGQEEEGDDLMEHENGGLAGAGFITNPDNTVVQGYGANGEDVGHDDMGAAAPPHAILKKGQSYTAKKTMWVVSPTTTAKWIKSRCGAPGRLTKAKKQLARVRRVAESLRIQLVECRARLAQAQLPYDTSPIEEVEPMDPEMELGPEDDYEDGGFDDALYGTDGDVGATAAERRAKAAWRKGAEHERHKHPSHHAPHHTVASEHRHAAHEHNQAVRFAHEATVLRKELAEARAANRDLAVIGLLEREIERIDRENTNLARPPTDGVNGAKPTDDIGRHWGGGYHGGHHHGGHFQGGGWAGSGAAYPAYDPYAYPPPPPPYPYEAGDLSGAGCEPCGTRPVGASGDAPAVDFSMRP